VYPTDMETRRQLALVRTASLAEARRNGESHRRTRQRLGFWMVEVGLRLACERPSLSHV
jgi:hypothetical protein